MRVNGIIINRDEKLWENDVWLDVYKLYLIMLNEDKFVSREYVLEKLIQILHRTPHWHSLTNLEAAKLFTEGK